ncbi:MAG: IS21 family transposase [Chloroflexi bacterium]|nr:IS21 family transposase [Chloroflexota bacterium]
MLDPKSQVKILQLHYSEGLSRQKIASQLGINRKTVSKVITRRTVRLHGQPRQPRQSQLQPYHARIDELLQKAPGRSAVNILQRLRPAGYLGGITILRDYLRTVRAPAPKEAFYELDFAMGEAAQVDWGEFGDVFGDGTKVHCFVMVLCWSRLLYLEFTLRETLGALLRCYERALRFFGGRCSEYWHDNMPTVVAERVGNLSRFTVGFSAYVGFHGFNAVLCNVRAPHEKGRVEDGVKFVRNQFWPGRDFRDLADINTQAVQWRDLWANRREHASTGKVPELMFAKEREALLPLRPEPYDTDEVTSCEVSRFFRVRFETNFYTVPWTLVGKTVTVRADDRTVRVFYGPKRVTQHERCYLKHQKIENLAHRQGLDEHKPGAQRTGQLAAVESYGQNTRRYLELITAGTRSLRAELRELGCLGTVYGPQAVERTIGELLAKGVVGAGRLERTLRLQQDLPQAPPPMPLSDERLQFVPPAPQLGDYDALLLDARHGDSDEAASTAGGETGTSNDEDKQP